MNRATGWQLGDEDEAVAVAQSTERRTTKEGLAVATELYEFVRVEVLPGTGVDEEDLWRGLHELVDEFGPRNRELLDRRDELQASVDRWHRVSRETEHDAAAYRARLEAISYIEPEGPDFTIETTGVDHEVSDVAGPQLVVPVTNARYALNAANARWGSLYDAVYGTDVLGDPPPLGGYDEARGHRVIEWVKHLLDEVVPLVDAAHADVTAYRVDDGLLAAELAEGSGPDRVGLGNPAAFAGYTGSPEQPSSLLFRHHGLHFELVVDRTHRVGRSDRAGIADVILEAAVTTIVDLEDSVATVDESDKVLAYRNWCGLMRGDLAASFRKDGQEIERRLSPDRQYRAPDGSPLVLPGRAVLMVRNVGLLTTTSAVLDRDGHEIPEGILDALISVLVALHDLRGNSGFTNSRTGAAYVVKPKLHGSEEAVFTDELFGRVEAILGLATDTVKVGIMDEERRTSVNLKECIRAVRSRVAFINTGFLDRTGDEIHTSMEAGAVVPKAFMREQCWLAAYEQRNVAIGLACGFRGRAQIGKGMWPAPDLMAQMLADKVSHPLAGANCAWVPSPTAATLHATHYLRVDVAEVQRRLAAEQPRPLDDLLEIPTLDDPPADRDKVIAELENNAQGILGYVVRWVDQGIGCSKVPDTQDVALMEDRATCRISSQHIANWLHHGIVDVGEVRAALRRMAEVVDRQNAGEPNYQPMAPRFDGEAFRAAHDLVFGGREQPSGYTEPTLQARRRRRKQQLLEGT